MGNETKGSDIKVNKKVWIGIAVLLCFLMSVSVVSATTESFTYTKTLTEEYYVEWATTQTDNPKRLVLENIDYWNKLDNLFLYHPSSGYTIDAGSPDSASTDFVINSSGVDATGTMMYSKVPSNGIKIYLFFDSWDIGTESGLKNLELNVNWGELYNLKLTFRGTFDPADYPEAVTLYYFPSGGGSCYYGNYTATGESYFRNDYTYSHSEMDVYYLDITKTVGGGAYQSKWKVWTKDGGEYLNETSFASDNKELIIFEAPIYMQCADLLGNNYSDVIYPTGATIIGYTYNAETGVALGTVNVTYGGWEDTSDSGGYYILECELGTYTLSATKTGYHTTSFPITLAYTAVYEIDIPLVPYPPTHTGHGIFGRVRTLPYWGICENQTVHIENATWSDTTTTNSVGYYGFDNLEVDDYWINVSKDAYRDNNQSVNISSTNDVIVTIDNCDAATNWSSDNSLTLNTTDKQEGTGSLQSSGSNTLDFNKSAPSAVDASNVTKSNGYLVFWYKVNDTTRLDDYITITVGSDGNNATNKISWLVDKGYFTNDTWLQVGLKFSDGTETGTLNMSNVSGIEVKAPKSDVVTSKIDDVFFIDYSYVLHDVDLDPILSLGVIAKTTNEEVIASFTAILDGSSLNTTSGEELIFTDLHYGMKELTVTSEGYFPYQRSVYLDSNTNITAYMQVGGEGGAGVYYPPPHLVEFRVQNTWGKPFSNALVTAQGYSTTMGTWGWLKSKFGFDNSSELVNTTMSDTTDSNGQLSFLMVETVKYQINVSDTESPARFNDKTFWIYPKDERYNLVVSDGWKWQKAGTEEQKEMSINVTTLIINTTHAYINVSYNDPSNQTTNLTIYVNQTVNNNEEECLNSSNWVNTSVQNYSYIATPYKGRAYKIQVVTEHEEWGNKTWTYAKRFEGMLIDLGLPSIAYPMIAIAVLLFLGGVFGRSSATQGSLVICFGGWFFWAIGFLTMIPTATILSALALASVVSIIAIMMEKSRKTGVQ